MSMFAIRSNRRQETVSVSNYSLMVTKRDHNFWNSVAAKNNKLFYKIVNSVG